MGRYYHVVCLDCKEYALLGSEGFNLVYEEYPEGMTEGQIKGYQGVFTPLAVCYFMSEHPGHRVLICTEMEFDSLQEKEWNRFRNLFPGEDFPSRLDYEMTPPFDQWNFPLIKQGKGGETAAEGHRARRAALRDKFNRTSLAGRELTPYYDKLEITLREMRGADKEFVEQLGVMKDRIFRIHDDLRGEIKEIKERIEALEKKAEQ